MISLIIVIVIFVVVNVQCTNSENSTDLCSITKHCEYCGIKENNTKFNDYICLKCESDYVSVEGRCIKHKYLPKPKIKSQCIFYDFNLECDNCKYNKQNCPLLFISKYSLGQIFYLYVIPIIGGIALIIAGVFLLYFYFLKKQKNCVDPNKKEEKKLREDKLTLNKITKCSFITEGKKCLLPANYHFECGDYFCENHYVSIMNNIKKENNMSNNNCPICGKIIGIIENIDVCHLCKTKQVVLHFECGCIFCQNCSGVFLPSGNCPICKCPIQIKKN